MPCTDSIQADAADHRPRIEAADGIPGLAAAQERVWALTDVGLFRTQWDDWDAVGGRKDAGGVRC